MFEVLVFYVYLGGAGRRVSYYSEVLRYDPATDQWVKTGDMYTPRFYHRASVVTGDVIPQFCNSE